MGLDLEPERFKVIANYSFVWHRRAQAPVDHGTADISTVHELTLLPEEMAKVKLDEKEYSDARWFSTDDVLVGEFHPALKQAIRDLRAKRSYEALAEAVTLDDAQVAQRARELVALVSEGQQPAPVHAIFD